MRTSPVNGLALLGAVALAGLGLGWSLSGADAQSSGQEKSILEMTRSNWVSIRDWQGNQLIYFTHLEAWRCGIARVRYSVNSDALDREWKLSACDPANPNAIGTDKPYVTLPGGSVTSVSVQVTYADGTASDIVRATP
jgi:hypothetical protein